MNEEGSALQTLTVEQTDDNIIAVDVENEHVTDNKDDITTIGENSSKYEELVNILLSKPKIESIPENGEIDETIMSVIPGWSKK